MEIKKDRKLIINCNNKYLIQFTLFRIIFWIGYIAILITTLIPIKGFSFNKINLGPESFHLRLDHLLHFSIYFMICIYYLAGLKKGLLLFTVDSLKKFVLLILILATGTELLQLWVPDRAFNVFDILANIAGMVAGVAVIRLVQSTELREQGKKDENSKR